MNPYCPRCDTRGMTGADPAKTINDYIQTLPDEIKTPPEEYRRRLAICETCDQYLAHVCMLCGCYVAARAAKRAQYCPGVTDHWRL